jgi:hypothetical protein
MIEDADASWSDRRPYQVAAPSSEIPWPAVGVVLLSVALYLALCGLFGYGLIDDSFISLRYAANLANGQGLVFNSGECVEGYSNFLFTVLLAAGIRIGLDGPNLAIGLGVASGVAAMVLAFLVAWKQVARSSALEASSVCLYLAVSLPFVCYSVSGMETVFLTVLLLLSIQTLLSSIDSPRWVACSALVLAAAGLTRPETPVLFLYNLVALSWMSARCDCRVERCHILVYAVIFAALVGAHLLWRHHYYGFWLPNTYYAKVGTPTLSLMLGGLGYVGRFVIQYALLVPILLALVVAGSLRSNRRLLYLVGFLVVHLGAVLLEGGDHFPMLRLCVPVVPIVAILSQELGSRVASRSRARLETPSPAAARGGIVLLLVLAAGATSSLLIAATDHRSALSEVRLTRNWAAFGNWLKAHSEEQDSIALLTIGAIGYYSGLHVIDMAGLTDVHVAHLPVPMGAGYLGHEKFDAPYVLAQRPTYLLTSHLVLVPRPIDEIAYREMALFDVHRRLIAMPVVGERYEFQSVDAPSGGFFVFYRRRGDLPTTRSWEGGR